MTPVLQTRFGKDGNCWPACIASLLDEPIEAFDHCACSNEDWHQRTQSELAKRGLMYVDIRRQGKHWPCCGVESGSLVILGGKSPRGLPHVVIGRAKAVKVDDLDGLDFDLVHDPIPGDGERLVEVDSLIILVRRFVA